MIKRLLSVHKDIFGVVIIVLCLIGVKEMSAQGLEIQDLFVGGENGYHTYRIPSIIVTPSGAVLAFCEGRKNGGGDAGKIDLLMKRSEDGGKTWTEQTIVWDDGINTCGNPCPVVDEETGTIWMFLTWNLGGDHEKQIHLGTSTDTRRVFLTSSTDDGKTWVKPVDLTNELKPSTWRWYATGPGVGIQVKNGQYKGRMVIPCDYSEVESDGKTRYGGSHIVYSDDHGKTWLLGGTMYPKMNECQVVELSDGSLLMNSRSSKCGTRAFAWSTDGGITWPKIEYNTPLPDPVCQASTLRIRTGEEKQPYAILFSNAADSKERIKMTIQISYDDCKTWPLKKVVYPGPSAYSCLTQLNDGMVLCMFESWVRKRYAKIRVARFPLALLGEK